ncbi:heparin lyase I family protein [Kitasatospora viridis]|uniref:Polysaccharide lyase-like protein n=1 Tax=Kitasatospora viridis TaxID=281105 RepID=A0A561T667_9ACTN|nr:heparin lyase I family protein [Kitasatospora viridis]TWF82606.1 polysaccharide lyase-like protein [Kitasatospora viridis]
MATFNKTVTSFGAAALLVPALLACGRGNPPAHPAHPGHGRTHLTATQILQVDYESGTPDSGLPGLSSTDATAPDAAAVVRPGEQSAYAIQHKVTLGDPGYFSDGAPRSESATDRLPNGVFHIGDTQRYEFSVLLKDWQPYQPGDSDTGDIIFQGKYSGGQPPAFYFMTKRNAIAFRSPQMSRQTTVVSDFRPYVNQWLDFRVDAKWATDQTGYFQVSVRLPGQSDYQQMASYTDVATWQPSSAADYGYLKWGLYRPAESLANDDVATRIVQHDNIRVFDLS